MNTHFIKCEKCGKKLIERKPNGIWVFKFGKGLVDIEIYGSIQMKCLRRSCRHLNVLSFFPDCDNFEIQTNSGAKN